MGGHLAPLPSPFSPKSPDRNSEIAILFDIVERSDNYALGYNMAPTAPGGKAVSYEIYPSFTFCICYREVQTFFVVVGGQGWLWEFFLGKEIFGVNIPG